MRFHSSTRCLWTFGLTTLMGLACAGCGQQFGTLLYFMGAGRGEKVQPQIELTKDRLAVFVDDPDELISTPEAIGELINEIGKIFRANDVNQKVVAADEVIRHVYSRPEHARWSIRQVGEKLGAVQVLYIKVRRFALHDRPGDPLYRGQWEVAVKLVSTERQADVRLWPPGLQGMMVKVDTPISQAEDTAHAVNLAKGMARELAQRIAFFFYEHTLDAEQELNRS